MRKSSVAFVAVDMVRPLSKMGKGVLGRLRGKSTSAKTEPATPDEMAPAADGMEARSTVQSESPAPQRVIPKPELPSPPSPGRNPSRALPPITNSPVPTDLEAGDGAPAASAGVREFSLVSSTLQTQSSSKTPKKPTEIRLIT